MSTFRNKIMFQDVKILLEYGLRKFYQNDYMLLDYDDKTEYVSERSIVFHIGRYMKEKMDTLSDFDGANLDCEYNRNMNDPKRIYYPTPNGLRARNIIPDLIIHKRMSNDDNLLVIEFKKQSAPHCQINNDIEKLKYLTNDNYEYNFKYGLLIFICNDNVCVKCFKNGKEWEDYDLSANYLRNNI